MCQKKAKSKYFVKIKEAAFRKWPSNGNNSQKTPAHLVALSVVT